MDDKVVFIYQIISMLYISAWLLVYSKQINDYLCVTIWQNQACFPMLALGLLAGNKSRCKELSLLPLPLHAGQLTRPLPLQSWQVKLVNFLPLPSHSWQIIMPEP